MTDEERKRAAEVEAREDICNGCTWFDYRLPACNHEGGPELPKREKGEPFNKEILRSGECIAAGWKKPRSKRANCYKCAHKREVPGSAHSRCNNPKAKVIGHPRGVRSGWFGWPFNFDPTWLLDCNGFSAKAKDKKAATKRADPLTEIGAILGSVGR